MFRFLFKYTLRFCDIFLAASLDISARKQCSPASMVTRSWPKHFAVVYISWYNIILAEGGLMIAQRVIKSTERHGLPINIYTAESLLYPPLPLFPFREPSFTLSHSPISPSLLFYHYLPRSLHQRKQVFISAYDTDGISRHRRWSVANTSSSPRSPPPTQRSNLFLLDLSHVGSDIFIRGEENTLWGAPQTLQGEIIKMSSKWSLCSIRKHATEHASLHIYILGHTWK